MRYFATRIFIGFVCLIGMILVCMGIGYGLDAPILLIDTAFVDTRTQIIYSEPAPQDFAAQQLSGVNIRPSANGQLLLEILRDGREQTVIVRNPHGDEIARFAPDERFRGVNAIWIDATRLLLMRQLNVAGSQQWSIWNAATDSERVLGVYDEPAPPAFSPDNQWLVLQPKRDHPRTPMPASIYSTQTDTVYRMGEASIAASWSPDSRWFTAQVLLDNDQQALQLLDTVTGTLYQEIFTPSSVLRLNWSADSQYLLVNDNTTLRIFHEGEQIFLREIDGLRLGHWSPDNTSILLEVRGEENENVLYMLDIAGGSPRYVMTMPENLRLNSIQWIADSTGFTYLSETTPPMLYAYEFATGDTRPIATLPHLERRSSVQWVSPELILN